MCIRDSTYIITVGTHGDYPKEPVIENPTYTVSGVEDEGMKNAWTYYVNPVSYTHLITVNGGFHKLSSSQNKSFNVLLSTLHIRIQRCV